MAGLVLGVEVTGPDRTVPLPARARRELQLTIDPDGRYGTTPSYKVGLASGGIAAPRINSHAVPGPVMVLARGEPVAVEIVNGLREPTAIHWHGIELESYDDGVPGFGGTSGSVTPAVAPGGRFTARFTPSRAGTFIYHTHWHNPGQLAGGIYGPIIVLEPGETYQPARDHIIVLGLDGPYRPQPDEAFAVNGENPPQAMNLAAGVTHRLRFINITGDNVALTVQLTARFDPVQWTLIAKDGAATPPAQRKLRPARQLVAVGETYDFELAPMPPTPVGLWMELRRGNGEQLFQWPVRVRQP
jgi:FtsP/CotA-like multicopper oxidase with cupredoxin domain